MLPTEKINVCYTSKVHRVNDRRRPVLNNNTKLTAGKYKLLYAQKLNLLLISKELNKRKQTLQTGILHARIGATHVNVLLTLINLPVIHKKSLKATERRIGPAFEKIAKRSCKKSVVETKFKQ